jgi:virginiamycin B lyase
MTGGAHIMNHIFRRALAPVLLVSSFAAGAAVIKEFPLPAGSNPQFLASGPDGNIWFTEPGKGKIGRITPAGMIAHFDITLAPVCFGPDGITLAADGRIWYTCPLSETLGRMSINGSTVGYAAPGGHAPAGPIAGGADGLLYYTTSDKRVEVVDLNGIEVNYDPLSRSVFGIAAGLNGAVWFGEDGDLQNPSYLWSNSYDHIHAIAHSEPSNPYLVAWCETWGHAFFTEPDAGKIARQLPAETAADQFDVGIGSRPAGIACGAEGSVWYTMPGANKIGRFKRDCFCSETFDVPTASAGVLGITVGPDGSVWFAESSVDKIGRIQLRPQGDADGNGIVDVSDVFWLINFLFAGGPAPV